MRRSGGPCTESNGGGAPQLGALRICAQKFGGIPHYQWQSTVLAAAPAYVVCCGEPRRQVVHHSRGRTFTVDNWCVEFFSFALWFTVHIDIVAGQIRQHYCNIAAPARLEGGVLSFIDLDLDLVRTPGEDWKVLDEDELISNAARFGYPSGLTDRAWAALEDLRRRIAGDAFPFDGTLRPAIEAVITRSRT